MNDEQAKPMTIPPEQQAAAKAGDSVPKKKAEKIDPSLSVYFGSKPIPAKAFAKAVKAAKFGKFGNVEEEQGSELMASNDVDGARLLGLLMQSDLPQPLDLWIWSATERRLTSLLGTGFDPAVATTAQLFAALRAHAAVALADPDKGVRKPAQNWLRIGILWLVRKRSLEPWLAIDQCVDLLFKKGDAPRSAGRAVRRGKWTEFRQAVAVAGLARAVVEGAIRERDEDRRLALNLQRKLAETTGEIEGLRSRLA